MKIVNVGNQKRMIYLFCREADGTLNIQKDEGFWPYFYEPDVNGQFEGYDGQKLRKVFCREPADVTRLRSPSSYEADIRFPVRYVIDKVPTFDECPIRILYLDIEVLAKEFPDFRDPKYPISCITTYDTFSQEYRTFFLGDYAGSNNDVKEGLLLQDFVNYFTSVKPDIWTSYNVTFDYNYLDARIDMLAQKISPVHRVRLGDHENEIFYPLGVSIVDYLALVRKVFMREQSYTLNAISAKYLGETEAPEAIFSKLDEQIKLKNVRDVKNMVALEEKFKLFPYFDEIRRLTRCQWEDFCVKLKGELISGNSRIVEMLLFEQAKLRNVILPNKPRDLEVEEFEGAYRDVFELGVHNNAAKLDLGSAYPSVIMDFCLDPQNVTESEEAIEINGIRFRQNDQGLIPSVVKKLLELKNSRKKDLKQNPGDKQVQIRYDAIKAVVNSAYGVMGNRYFRIYDRRVASATTFLVRDVLHYVKDKLETKKIKVLYADTDSVVTNTKENISDLCNTLVQQWAKDKYGKKTISLRFEYEGYFESLLLMKKCRYLGYLNTGKGVKEEVKGIEAKRSDSSKFMARFQRALIDKILEKTSIPIILKWIVAEAKRMKTLPLEDVGFPCKVGKALDDYKNEPIFVRALSYAQELGVLDKVRGDLFYYLYIEPTEFDKEIVEEYYVRQTTQRTLKSGQVKEGSKKVKVTKTAYAAMSDQERTQVLVDKVVVKKPRNVMAFDKFRKDHIKKVDWNMMVNRNVVSKVEALFEALGWEEHMATLTTELVSEELIDG